jgi:hypothetical protein
MDMLGAIAGDIIGSAHEAAGTKTTEFPLFDEYARFTDDSRCRSRHFDPVWQSPLRLTHSATTGPQPLCGLGWAPGAGSATL